MNLPLELSLFWDIGLIITAATLTAFIARFFRQPVILAYIVAGVLIGPGALGLITNPDIIRTLSEFGIAFLLFIVGLELDLRKLKDVGLPAVFIGIVKSILMFAFAFMFSTFYGLTRYEATYLGLVLAFSSTMIVVKLLSGKNELATLHGRMLVGILLAEDVLAILALSILSTPGDFSVSLISESVGKGFILLLITMAASKVVLPYVFDFVSKSQELMFLTALSICFILAGLAQVFGFSLAIGSFLGGLAIASFPYNIEIISRIESLRDFFSTIFFVSLGMGVGISFNTSLLFPLLVFLILVVVVKPFIIMLMCSNFGYSSRTSFLTSINLTQISEFSLIMVIQGLKLGHIGQDVFSITVFLALITITMTSYLSKFDELLYRIVSKRLVPFEGVCFVKKRTNFEIPEESHIGGHKRHVVVCGYHRMGYSVVKALKEMDRKILVIEFDPDIIKGLCNEGIPAMYGDIGDIEVLRRANLTDAEIVISTVPRLEDNLLLIDEAKKMNARILVIVTASSIDHALELYEKGADYVVLPKWFAGEKAAELIGLYMKNPHIVSNMRKEHVRHIERIRKEEFFDKYNSGIFSKLSKKLKRMYEEE
jgi:Kef-type K+ transport system membrane component KefB/voltage-gated potassium channel Kch